jgi:hypothetical protein
MFGNFKANNRMFGKVAHEIIIFEQLVSPLLNACMRCCTSFASDAVAT